jgi:polyphosphate kinase
VLKEQDILLHHPYDSFQTVVDLLKQAAEDPNVLAIKQTLYRNSGENSQVVKQLIRAVENQKQVTVLLELKARFDEEKNILWAQKLEEAGCHVIYGLKGLKTHSKALLIVRKEENGQIRRYMHFGTGNYNEKTAKLYTDISFLTSSENYAVDTSSFFNYLTGYALEPDWNKFSIAPTGIRNKILRLIDEEIQHQKNGREGHVIAKMNSLVDQRTIEKLYEASRNGVKVDLIIRGICCLRAGVKGLSENIRVVSIVGRFLEHSRIFYFRNGGHGKERVYISSADWMPRNFDRRVELMVPIESENAKDKLIRLLTFNLMDNQKSRVLLDSTYVRKERGKKETPFLIHEEMLV